jgi:hypothetical protein
LWWVIPLLHWLYHCVSNKKHQWLFFDDWWCLGNEFTLKTMYVVIRVIAMLVVLLVFTPDHGIKPHYFTRARSTIVPVQAVKQFTSTSCLHFRKEPKLLYMPEQRYSANDRRKDFMINHNESDQRRPGIEPGSPDSQFNILSIELTGRLRL